ncbi:alcohol dehydrogenase [Mycoplasma wenyonii str. Massachusetts]|uniref:Alcohol dehydrogenase n=1 Tax=Mycoplasma wenyonii (strain Massachusetts) TaxID=1197325 RepID=I6Z5S7_MYCWM|nr:iron-containing alcohol dehydrogenase [Mycoplasma wenyonii]AFN64918.1 alcohol dehydrogenase [Mycoplasma wenyonii str. Massachusetts]
MSSLASKAKGTTNKLFPKKAKEDISESIYKNALDSQLFFQFQRSSFQLKPFNTKTSSVTVNTIQDEFALNKFKSLITDNKKNFDYNYSNLDPLQEPNYEEFFRVREERKNREEETSPTKEVATPKKQKNDKRKIPLLNNWEVGEDTLEKSLLFKLKKANINSLMILSDDSYTRQLISYKKIVALLEDNKIPYYEYTNIQPSPTKEVVQKIVKICNKHRTNSILVVGSNSLIDFAKLIIRKLIKPTSIRMQSNSSRTIVSSYFSMFTVPTLVLPSTKTIDQQILTKKPVKVGKNQRGNSIFLFNPIDSSDFVAYFPSLLLEYKKSKQQELLHLLFFRLIFSYFDSQLTTEDRMRLVRELKSIEWYLDYLENNPSLSLIDAKIIMVIAAKCFDGRYFMTKSNYWTWFKLAANLTQLTKLEYYKSLALFLPSFLEYITVNDKEGQKRALELSYLLFGLASTEGLVLQLIKHIKKYKLPQKFYDIPKLKEINSKFMNQLIKQSSPFLSSYKMTKTIIQNLAVW